MNKALKIKYNLHKARSKQRGIEFKLTFDEWLEIWKPFIHKRGRKWDQYGMCRIADNGAYEVGNVFIGSPNRNAKSRKARTTLDGKRPFIICNSEDYDEEGKPNLGYASIWNP